MEPGTAYWRKRPRDAEGRFSSSTAKVRKTNSSSIRKNRIGLAANHRFSEFEAALRARRSNTPEPSPSLAAASFEYRAQATPTGHAGLSIPFGPNEVADPFLAVETPSYYPGEPSTPAIGPPPNGFSQSPRSADQQNSTSLRYYSHDEQRNKMLRQYFLRNPVEDTELALQAYYQKYSDALKPVDYGDNTPDKLLLCVCLQPDDGEIYIECENGVSCNKQFYHPECLGLSEDMTPNADEEWYCPACMKEGRGGAAAFKQKLMRQAREPRNVIRRATTAHVRRNSSNLAVETAQRRDVPIPIPTPTVKPWTADLDKSLTGDPDNIHDLNIETLDSAKKTLRQRAAQKLGKPEAPAPSVRNGTVVTMPNKNSWSSAEDAHLIAAMTEASAEGLSGNPLWDAVMVKLADRGIHRKLGGARNRWMRGLRQETMIDERRKKNPNKLTTAVQAPKAERDSKPPSNRRYQASRKHDAPSGHVQSRVQYRSQFAPPTARGEAPTAPASSPVREPQVVALEIQDFDAALTDAEDIKARLKRRRARSQ